ncbi:hypothetical protein B0J12DRAFT_698707 [Macrophomina phaseolina]|uniref:Zn(2)-C6 fungal-type domain-containing protein n=1 Tax=Macrophomina phaseolina TaxID=35725 RepID=A0ABQ8GCE0_9PEZI|nr:hypothetical protein B0J12DRAFT_698707 [Macrophomina phaseolina]
MTDNRVRPPRSRRHITTACWPCREDKVKCDGATPECQQCIAKNRECAYAGVDRRKLSLRKAVEAFSQRVRQLEAFVRAHNIAVPPVDPEHEAILSQLSSIYAPEPEPASFSTVQSKSPENSLNKQPRTLPNAPPNLSIPAADTTHSHHMSSLAPLSIASLPQYVLHANENGLQEASANIILQADVSDTTLPFNHCLDGDWVWNHSAMSHIDNDMDMDGFGLWAPRVDGLLSHADAVGSSSDPSASTLLNEEESTDDEDQSAVTNQLSARLGSLLMTDSGEWHFYGATSNLNLARGKLASALYAKPNEKRRRAHVRLEAAGIDQAISSELEDHLLQLFFTWHNPSLYTVDRDIFSKARKEYAEGCAVGAAFETRKHPDLPSPLADFFASRATTLLDIELEHPRIATVQALAILSSHEAAWTRDTQGWLFSGMGLANIRNSGMALRLAIDFGLHVSAKPYVEAGSMSRDEARGRSVAFWGAFATDRMWGLYVGRPFHNISPAISMETPIPFSQNMERYWTPVSRGRHGPENDLLDNQEVLVERSAQLSWIMSPLEGSLYFQADVSKVELQRLAEDTWENLLAWRRNLAKEIDLDLDSPMPAKCVPHILVLQPFVAKRYIQPYPLVSRGPQHAREMCVRAASRIAILLSWYEERYSLSYVNIQVVQITFSAALILVYATLSEGNPQRHRKLTGHLEMCCRALAELGNTFSNATRTLDVLLHVKRT